LRYRLGPALIQLGEAARAALRIPEAMSAELAALSLELGVTALAGKRAGGEIVVVDAHYVPGHMGLTMPLGQRVPLQAPFGILYVGWGSAEEINEWIDRAVPPMSDHERREMFRSVELVRTRGCSIMVRRPSTSDSRPRLRSAIDVAEARMTSIELPEIPDQLTEWTVLGIQAPVFEDTELMCTVSVTGFPYPMATTEIFQIAERVLAAAAAVAPRGISTAE
jgi:DNA-binding IclR family transcriptional regulator